MFIIQCLENTDKPIEENNKSIFPSFINHLFKNIFIFGVIILLLVGVAIIQYATPSRTVDFRGEILRVAVSDDGIVTLSAASDIEGPFLFRIDDKSKLENCCGEEITVDDLTKGTMVDINYRKYLFKDEEVHTVKSLKVYE